MITYEITASVRADLCESYERYMQDEHIPDLLNTGSFIVATFTRSTPGRYRICYQALDRASLDRYIAEHAPRLRAHLLARFPDGVELTREEWLVLKTWAVSE